jgi:hypothetical protein
MSDVVVTTNNAQHVAEVEMMLARMAEAARAEERWAEEIWAKVSEYVLGHRSDIEHGINDFGDLKPVLDWIVGIGPGAVIQPEYAGRMRSL